MILSNSPLIIVYLSIGILQGYYLVQTRFDQSDAENYCLSHCNSRLASIHSQSDQDEILSLEMNTLNDFTTIGTDTDAWIGLAASNSIDNDFSWSDGALFDYGSNLGQSPWNPTEPLGGSCVQMDFDNYYGQWFSLPCGQDTQRSICNHCSSQLTKYIALRNPNNATNAEQQCQTRIGTHLASAHSQRDLIELQTLCESIGSSRCWIGAFGSNNRNFSWIDGTSFDIADNYGQYPWDEFEPQSFGFSEDCVVIDTDRSSLWNNVPCYQSNAILCNFPSETCGGNEAVMWYPIQWNGYFEGFGTCDGISVNDDFLDVINKKQWNNHGQTLLIDITAILQDYVGINKSGNLGIVLYNFKSFCWYYFAGFECTKTQCDVVLRKYHGVDYITLDINTTFVMQFGISHNLRMEVTNGIMIDIFVNDDLYISYTDDDILTPTGISTDLSGYIGFKSERVIVTAKSLYVSGDPVVNYDTPFLNWTNILCNVSFENASIITPSPVTTPVTVPLENTERTYYISPNRLSWFDAEDYCVNHCGSHLASIHSQEQWLAVGVAVESDIYNETYKRDISQYQWSNAVWTGLIRNENDTGYIYSDGSIMDYGDAEIIYNNSVANGNCVQLDIDQNYTPKGVNCNSLARVLCNSCDGKLNKYLMIKVNKLTWGNAERFCYNHFRFGKLASFHDERDFDEMRLLCDDANTRDNKLCHIGLGAPAGNNQFRWSDDTDFNYGDDKWWAFTNEPNADHSRRGDGQCAGIYTIDNGVTIDYACNNTEYVYNFICQRPSELCSFNKYWTANTFGVRGDMKWNSNNCRLSNSMTNTTHTARMNGKQFRNNNGLLLMEFVFNVDDVGNQGQNGNIAVFVSMDGNYINNHWIAVYFTISKTSADVQLITTYTNDTQQSILAERSNLPFIFNSDHILRISVDSHTQYNVILDGEELFDYTYTQDSCERCIGIHLDPTLSGYIGTRSQFIIITIKSIYVSGSPLFNFTSLSPTNSPTVVTDSPSISPTSFTTAPATNLITEEPSSAPNEQPTTNVKYGVTVKIDIKYKIDKTVDKTRIDEILKNVTDSIIDDVIKNRTNATDCLLSNDYDISINQIKNRTVINATIIVCDEETQSKLSVDIDNTLEQDFVNLISDTELLQIDEINTNVGSKIIYDGEVPETTISSTLSQEPITSSDEDTLFIIYISGGCATLFVICCILSILIWKHKHSKSVQQDKELSTTMGFTPTTEGFTDNVAATMTEMQYVKSKSDGDEIEDEDNGNDDLYIQTTVSTPSGLNGNPYETNGRNDMLQNNNIDDKERESDEEMYNVNDENVNEIVTPKGQQPTANGETIR